MGKSALSIRQRPDGRWEARITIGYDPGTGERIRKSVYALTKAECRKAATAIQAQVDAGTYQEPNKLTIKEWLDEWLTTFAKTKVRQSTYAAYEAIIKNHIDPALGAIKIQTLRGFHIQKFYNSLVADGKSAKTVVNIAAVLHRALDVALKQGLIVANPCDAAELPKKENKEIHPLTDAEIPLFLDAINESEFSNAYAFCLFSGLREGELLGLSWNRIDFDTQRVTVSQQLQRMRADGSFFLADYTKSGKPRVIQPPAIAFRYLRAERARQATNQLAAGPVWDNDLNLVFTTDTGRYIDPTTFYRTFKRIARKIGRPDLRVHDLRHTAATVAIAAGSDIKSVQSLLGHATASFTLNVYAHTSDAMREDTANRVQNYYENLAVGGNSGGTGKG